MLITVKDIIGAMNTIAPPDLAESWDNVGLQVGDPGWEVRRIWMALDPLPEVIQAAANRNIDLIITHHPLLLKSISRLDLSKPIGNLIGNAIQQKIAIFSSHTNLDKVTGGINDILAQMLNLTDIDPIIPDTQSKESVKLVIFTPLSHKETVLNALFEKNAGVIGNYSKCSFSTEGLGTFQPNQKATPYIGKKEQFENVQECRIETLVALKDLHEIIRFVEQFHPYETMAYDIYTLHNEPSQTGIGRKGSLKNPMKLKELANTIIQLLNIPYVRMIGDPDMKINQLAICSGSGGSLLKTIFSLDVQAYVTGDIKYHDARDIEANNIGAIDAGHFETEHLFIEHILPRLKNYVEMKKWPVEIMPCPIEKSPFQITFNHT
jgi:dinuclear metal center YbgI/SA1388 family protein